MIGKFLRGFIDGSLSTLGIVIGASSGSAALVVAAAVGGSIANGFSNALSAFTASGSEEYQSIREIERAMVRRDLRGTELERGVSRRSTYAGLVDAAGTISGGAIPIWPYLVFDRSTALIVAIATVTATTGLVGLYMGRVSRQSILWSVVKMVVAAAVIAAAVFGVERLISPEQSAAV
jgi:predicted membrane protein (TIGR00267 family)